jgi:hypothetical protein
LTFLHCRWSLSQIVTKPCLDTQGLRDFSRLWAPLRQVLKHCRDCHDCHYCHSSLILWIKTSCLIVSATLCDNFQTLDDRQKLPWSKDSSHYAQDLQHAPVEHEGQGLSSRADWPQGRRITEQPYWPYWLAKQNTTGFSPWIEHAVAHRRSSKSMTLLDFWSCHILSCFVRLCQVCCQVCPSHLCDTLHYLLSHGLGMLPMKIMWGLSDFVSGRHAIFGFLEKPHLKTEKWKIYVKAHNIYIYYLFIYLFIYVYAFESFKNHGRRVLWILRWSCGVLGHKSRDTSRDKGQRHDAIWSTWPTSIQCDAIPQRQVL